MPCLTLLPDLCFPGNLKLMEIFYFTSAYVAFGIVHGGQYLAAEPKKNRKEAHIHGSAA